MQMDMLLLGIGFLAGFTLGGLLVIACYRLELQLTRQVLPPMPSKAQAGESQKALSDP